MRILFFALLFLMLSCQNSRNKTKDKPVVLVEVKSIEKDTSDRLKKVENVPSDLIEYLIYKRIKIENQLKKLDKNAGTDLYIEYKKETDSIVQVLAFKKENYELQDNYYSTFFDQEGKPKKLSKENQSKIIKFKKAKLELWNVGEGLAELRTIPNFYLDLFENKVNPDFNEYLKLIAKDDAVLYAADAGLIISHKELGDRVLHWESFLQKYPKFKFRKEVVEIYKYYQQNYIIGLDNTPFWDYETKELYPEAKEELLRFTKSNPKSKTTSLILNIIQQKNSWEEIYNFLEKEQLKLK